MCDDSQHSIAATVVFTEYLTHEAPDGRDGAEYPVPILDPMFVENLSDAGLSQDVREGESLIARKAGAHRIQARHGNDLVALKGHRSVGGCRASIYNAMPVEGVKALCQFMADFRAKNA